jgi:hypothetical protein
MSFQDGPDQSPAARFVLRGLHGSQFEAAGITASMLSQWWQIETHEGFVLKHRIQQQEMNETQWSLPSRPPAFHVSPTNVR